MCNNMAVGQKKIVEVFKNFFEKSVVPNIAENHALIHQWRLFSNIISSDPIDYGQIDFYLHMANKTRPNSRDPRQPISSEQAIKSKTSLANEYGLSDKKMSSTTEKRKNLVASVEYFHDTLLKNQEKLDSFLKRDQPISFYNTSSKRQY